MFYIFDPISRLVHFATNTQPDVMLSNLPGGQYVWLKDTLPTRYQGYWIINQQGKLENIIE